MIVDLRRAMLDRKLGLRTIDQLTGYYAVDPAAVAAAGSEICQRLAEMRWVNFGRAWQRARYFEWERFVYWLFEREAERCPSAHATHALAAWINRVQLAEMRREREEAAARKAKRSARKKVSRAPSSGR